METDITDDPDYMARWARAADAHSEREIAAHRAQEEEDAYLRAIPGYQALLDFFEGAFGVSIEIEADVDEDGPTGVYTASLSGVRWLCCDSGQGTSPEAAVKALRAEIIKALCSAVEELSAPVEGQP